MYFVLIVALHCLLNSRTKRFMNFFFLCPRNFESEDRRTVRSNAPYSSKFNGKKNRILFTYSTYSSRWFSSGVPSSMVSSAYSDQTNNKNVPPPVKAISTKMEFNRVNCLVWVLHESARSFSHTVESFELARCGPELAMAWVGVDVHAWHKRIAHQVAVYALLRTAIELEFFLSHGRCNNPSLVREILSPIINSIEQNIESQLKARHPKLVEWFRMVELPRIAGFFIPLLKKWSMEYAGSGVAGIILAISCCVAVGKLGSGHISCPLFISSIEDALIELMNLSHSLVSVDKLHQLATEAGFEQEFLYNFGTKILPSQKSEDVEFWIGLAQKKLAKAIRRESVFSGLQTFQDKVSSVIHVQESNCLATLGIFAFLGRKTRLFLLGMGIKDLDEQVKDFLSYLECGSLFIYPKFSSLSVYQLFMEVVADEIGWLDFYAAFPLGFNQERRRSKQHAIQAEKEIILHTVFTVCYDVFSGFAHFSSSTQQPLNADLLAFLLRSQSLLTSCLEDYWAAYDRSGYDNADFSSSQLQKIAERNALDQTQSSGTKDTTSSSVTLDAQQKVTDLMARRNPEKIPQSGNKLSKASCKVGTETRTLVEAGRTAESEALHQNLLRKSSMKLISTSSDIWMGTQLLFIDIMASLELLLKQMRGRRVTERERKKLKQTLADIASLIPVTILMLLPVSVVGHAAILAAIKKYMPSLIPSPYSSERLDVVKQLKRSKKMEVQTLSNQEDASSAISQK
ncbi:uncharacterized protein LOC100855084 isoform X2 [Vitis vinifera]|uniref:uncharacterized protein LOC100855084 isoform X2 n=1 Tax=Vitis vinifera TaxID=29760 RepID=UPI0008FFCC42|nr:uncharacterized protein LOC100855084 isoform X2 [Vitis vinifera]|eukprot:XP_019077491.1 PREDICTED: uncharacterized protein LOC100855084 isoform X2 [Vitis vinifera]